MSYQNRIMHLTIILTLTLYGSFAQAGGSGAIVPEDVTGVIGLRPVESNSCVAVWVSIPDGRALSGILWYNNDGATVFPEILLESGNPDSPVTLQECQSMAVDVMGQSSDWSELEFETPVGCLSEGLYVLFRFPEGDEYSHEGLGGGAALGYTTDGTGLVGWISAEGDDWVSFRENVGFAVQPVFVDAGEATIIMQGAQPDQQVARLVTGLQPPSPNPFNPKTRLQFTLAKDTNVELSVYNIRGQLIKKLLNEHMVAGSHEVEWFGRDSSGRHMASGVYFVRMKTDSMVMSRRMMLVQ